MFMFMMSQKLFGSRKLCITVIRKKVEKFCIYNLKNSIFDNYSYTILNAN